MIKYLVLVAVFLANTALAAEFKLSSTDIKANTKIADAYVFSGFGCTGGNKSPALEWKDPPAGTKSFAVTVYDPDAPTGSGWWHWVIFNIPASATKLAPGAGDPAAKLAPEGSVQTPTDFGKPGYGGPCPPKGDKPHRYIFTVHALKVEKLEVDANASGALVGFMINANRLGKASFTARYGR